MTKIKWNEFAYKLEQFNWCDANNVRHKTRTVLPLTLSPLRSNLQLRIPILIYFLTGQLGVPQLVHYATVFSRVGQNAKN